MHPALCVLLCFPLLSAVADDRTKAELTKLQGVWKVTAMEFAGLPSRGFFTPGSGSSTLVISGDRYTFNGHAGTIRLGADKQTIDLMLTTGDYKGELHGLYEVNGDSLQLALPNLGQSGGRPTELKTSAGRKHRLYTFARDGNVTTADAVAEQLKKITKEIEVATTPATTSRRSGGTTEELFRQMIERLDRIEKRLEEIDSKASRGAYRGKE